jgi:predicted nucleic acid-binding protein
MTDICLDTNVFSSVPEFLLWMGEKNMKGYLPAHAFMELSYYQMRRADRSVASFISTLAGLDIEIIPFDRSLAQIAANNALSKYDLSTHAVDYAIGAYAYKRKIPLITNNKKHFAWVDEVYTPEEFMKKHA